MDTESKKLTRREFMGLSALGLTSLTILPSWEVNGMRTASSTIRKPGTIGCTGTSIAILTFCPIGKTSENLI